MLATQAGMSLPSTAHTGRAAVNRTVPKHSLCPASLPLKPQKETMTLAQQRFPHGQAEENVWSSTLLSFIFCTNPYAVAIPDSLTFTFMYEILPFLCMGVVPK